jgi:uncharacterized protein (DUF1330 family)
MTNKPPVYLIFESEPKGDPSAYAPFAEIAAKELVAHGGEYLAFGGRAEALEGMPPKRIVISKWASIEDVKRWYDAPTMRPVNEARQKFTSARLFVVEGKAE